MTFQVGIRVDSDAGPLLTEVSSIIDYLLLEFVPGCPLSAWQLYALNNLGGSKAVTLHSFHSLSTPGVFTQEVIDSIQEAIDLSGASWYSEHICFAITKEGTDDVITLAAPLDDESLQVVCENAALLQEKLSVPLLLENLGRPFVWPWDDIDELTAIDQIVTRTGCKLVLDLAQASTSARTRGQSLPDYVAHYPPGSVQEVHVGPGAEGTELDREYLDLLRTLLLSEALHAVTLEGAEDDYRVAQRCIGQLRDLRTATGC